ncbi:hypothetical protein [Streptomyces sp. SCL15-4]|uniref:hypothetical protein n=1 Tax=Streptomyces sp. SCL15-4 TaxID=2967221 RepID=UPI0029670675|nr:hypothetical protein [Streptomyces sp. SCL15-4]
MSTQSSREDRFAQLLTTIRDHPGKWTAGRLHKTRRVTGGPVQRGTARRDLAELVRRGYLAQRGPSDGRYFTLRKDGCA